MEKRKVKAMAKLNLIPILDAIFIFIFFLLMSAQFIDIYQFGSDAPIVSTSSQEIDKKKPLNLTIKLSKKGIQVTTGVDNIISKEFKFTQLNDYNNYLIRLKKDHPKEDSAIFSPNKSFPYHKIVTVIDQTRAPAGNNKEKLFDRIIFDTVGE